MEVKGIVALPIYQEVIQTQLQAEDSPQQVVKSYRCQAVRQSDKLPHPPIILEHFLSLHDI